MFVFLSIPPTSTPKVTTPVTLSRRSQKPRRRQVQQCQTHSPDTPGHPARATAPGAALTVDLGKATRVGRTVVQASGATTAYRIDVSSDGAAWTPFGDPTHTATLKSHNGTTATYTAQGPAAPHVVSLEVYTE
ncbi:discoidin domain-containing protein [Streptomyces sp. NPDC088197]|uniref:discoidin domain-containing protein n=1 Tax=Streptomyces sp. NPDC088197 TaxID=3365840 RepID=UPI00382B39BA